MRCKNIKYVAVTMILFINPVVCEIFAADINSWGGNVQSEITTLAPSWLAGGISVSGLLCLVGSHLAYGFLSKIIMAAALIFGSASIVGIFQSIFS